MESVSPSSCPIIDNWKGRRPTMFGTFIIGSVVWGLASLISFLLSEPPLGLAVLFLGIMDGLAGLTIVNEGTARCMMWFGGFIRALMCWQEHEIDGSWNVTEKKGARSSGLQWSGWWLFNWTRTYCYNLRWRGIELGAKGERVQDHERVLDYVLLRPDIYLTSILGAETGGGTKKPGGRIPLDIEFLVTLQCINPFLTLFVGPPNWVENALAKLNALLSRWVAIHDVDYIQRVREEKDVDRLWEDIKDDPVIKVLRLFGIVVLGIQIRSVGMRPEDQEAAKAEQTQRFQARADAAETWGAVMEMISEVTGETVGNLQAKFREKPDETYKAYERLIEVNLDLVQRKLAIKGKAFVDIRTCNPLTDLLAAWRRMPVGDGGGDEGGKKGGLSEEERRRYEEMAKGVPPPSTKKG